MKWMPVLVWMLVVGIWNTAGAQRPGYVTILHYQWYDDPWVGQTGPPLKTFQEQMDYLKRNDYRVVPLSALRQMYHAGEPLLPKMVAITIEGSARTIYDQVYPILKSFGYSSVLFPYVKALDSNLPNTMTWEMVKTLYDSGVDMGILPYGDSHLGHPDAGQTRDDYRFRIRGEVLNAKRALIVHGITSDLFAFPNGEYNSDIINEAKAEGCGLMFTQDRGSLDARTPPTRIPQMVISAAMDSTHFAFDLSLSPLHVVNVFPEPGFLLVNPPRAFSLRLVSPENYRSGVVNMFLTEWGRVDAEYNSDTGEISFRPTLSLEKDSNRLTVTAKERNSEHFAMFSCSYLSPFDTQARDLKAQ